ncbi:MAG: hypothetical protein LBQ52_04285 [Helicobacteraceae bacterium]|nr:hypothetical protein [Helicobacteraceae bacterium]
MKRFVLFLWFCGAAFADSPITSTDIGAAYEDDLFVREALETKVLSDRLAAFLADSSAPIDVKIAVINAIGWEAPNSGKNADLFFKFLNKSKRYKDFNEFVQTANGEDLISMAYFKAMDDKISDAIKIAKIAKSRSPRSYTVNIIAELIEAQKALGEDWCEVFKLTDRVRQNKSLIKDMHQEAIDEIFAYMDAYESECPNSANDDLY